MTQFRVLLAINFFFFPCQAHGTVYSQYVWNLVALGPHKFLIVLKICLSCNSTDNSRPVLLGPLAHTTDSAAWGLKIEFEPSFGGKSRLRVCLEKKKA